VQIVKTASSHTGDLAAAVRNYTDIHFGLYYSLFEWYHPLFLQDKANQFKTNDYMRVRVVCACTCYVTQTWVQLHLYLREIQILSVVWELGVFVFTFLMFTNTFATMNL